MHKSQEGHYAINRDRFPDGLDGLKRTVRRFHDAGFRVGLHFLGPSVYPQFVARFLRSLIRPAASR